MSTPHWTRRHKEDGICTRTTTYVIRLTTTRTLLLLLLLLRNVNYHSVNDQWRWEGGRRREASAPGGTVQGAVFGGQNIEF